MKKVGKLKYEVIVHRDLQATIDRVDCDLVLIATPIDLTHLVNIDKPHMRIGYRLEEEGYALAAAVTRALSRSG